MSHSPYLSLFRKMETEKVVAEKGRANVSLPTTLPFQKMPPASSPQEYWIQLSCSPGADPPQHHPDQRQHLQPAESTRASQRSARSPSVSAVPAPAPHGSGPRSRCCIDQGACPWVRYRTCSSARGDAGILGNPGIRLALTTLRAASSRAEPWSPGARPPSDLYPMLLSRARKLG